MFYTSERDKLRQVYTDVWKKVKFNEKMNSLEQMIANVIEMHPEYHMMLNNENHIGNEYLPEMGETNPFLHMGMHLGLQEQVSLDRPTGIQKIYQQLSEQTGSIEKAEHAMMDCLAESLWLAQKHQVEPDEQQYLTCLQSLIKK